MSVVVTVCISCYRSGKGARIASFSRDPNVTVVCRPIFCCRRCVSRRNIMLGIDPKFLPCLSGGTLFDDIKFGRVEKTSKGDYVYRLKAEELFTFLTTLQ